MEEILFTTLVLVLGFAVHAYVLKVHTAKEARLLTYGFYAHVGASFLQILIYSYYYKGGDLLVYYRFGVPIAEALRSNFDSIFPETWKIFMHTESVLPFEIFGFGSTGTMSMVAVWLLFLLGNSLYASSLTIAIASYVSKVFIYRALREEFTPDQRAKVLAATMLVPTAVFWTSTLLKESVIMVFLGPLFLGIYWVLQGRRLLLAAMVLLASGLVVALLKAYVLMSFSVAAGLWVVWSRLVRRRGSMSVKPLYLALGLVIGIGGFTAADKYLTKGSSEGLVESMAYQRRVAGDIQGGSNFSLEDPNVDRSQNIGLAGQLALTPLALVTALFRPFIVEARNVMQLLNALETTWLLYMFLQVLRRNGISRLVSRITGSPVLMFCLAFALVLALGTGLSTSNLGTLSRYRAPMMPFLVVLLLFLSKIPTVSRVRGASPGEPFRTAALAQAERTGAPPAASAATRT